MIISESGSNVSWLLHTPIGDGNAQNALKNATIDELQFVLDNLPEQGNKTKIRVIKDEIKRRERK